MNEPSRPPRKYEPLPESFRIARAKGQGVILAFGLVMLFAAVHMAINASWIAAGVLLLLAVIAGVVAFWLVPLMTRSLDQK